MRGVGGDQRLKPATGAIPAGSFPRKRESLFAGSVGPLETEIPAFEPVKEFGGLVLAMVIHCVEDDFRGV